MLELNWCDQSKTIKAINDPFYDELTAAMNSLLPMNDSFMILEDYDRRPVQKLKHRPTKTDVPDTINMANVFIQTLLFDESPETELLYIVETRYELWYGSGEDDVIFRQFRLDTTDYSLVKKLFGEYFSGKNIDVTGWKEITEELKEEAVEPIPIDQ